MYRIKTTFLLALIFICQIACAQKKETVYLLFKDNNPVNCIKIESKSPKRDDTLRVKYEGILMYLSNLEFLNGFWMATDSSQLTPTNL